MRRATLILLLLLGAWLLWRRRPAQSAATAKAQASKSRFVSSSEFFAPSGGNVPAGPEVETEVYDIPTGNPPQNPGGTYEEPENPPPPPPPIPVKVPRPYHPARCVEAQYIIFGRFGPIWEGPVCWQEGQALPGVNDPFARRYFEQRYAVPINRYAFSSCVGYRPSYILVGPEGPGDDLCGGLPQQPL